MLKSARARDVFVSELRKARKELHFELIGYVVMPEQVHLLIRELKHGTPSTVLQKLKPRVSRRLRKRRKRGNSAQMKLPFTEARDALPSFWQSRFHNFNVFTERKRLEKLNYIHDNPVRRKLVNHLKDWLWSSWSHHFRRKSA